MMSAAIHRSIVFATYSLLVLSCYSTGDGAVERPERKNGAGHNPAEIRAEVVSVSGCAEKKNADGKKAKWLPLVAGDTLDALTVIRTGLGAGVVLRFADRGTVTIRNATKAGISSLAKRGKKVKTHLKLKYGSLRADVDSSRGPNDMTVSTPVATLGIKGTSGDVGFSGDFGLGLNGRRGTWGVWADGAGDTTVRGRQQTDGKLATDAEIRRLRRPPRLVDFFGLSVLDATELALNGGGRGVFVSGRNSNNLINPSPSTALLPWVVFRGAGKNSIPSGAWGHGIWFGGGIWVSDGFGGTWTGKGYYKWGEINGDGMETLGNAPTILTNNTVNLEFKNGGNQIITMPGKFIGRAESTEHWRGPGWWSPDGRIYPKRLTPKAKNMLNPE